MPRNLHLRDQSLRLFRALRRRAGEIRHPRPGALGPWRPGALAAGGTARVALDLRKEPTAMHLTQSRKDDAADRPLLALRTASRHRHQTVQSAAPLSFGVVAGSPDHPTAKAP